MKLSMINTTVNGREINVPVADFTEEVLAGAAFLDENAPGWLEKIELPDLQVQMPQSCVLGQVFAEKLRSLPQSNSALGGHVLHHQSGTGIYHTGFALGVDLLGLDNDRIEDLGFYVGDRTGEQIIDFLRDRRVRVVSVYDWAYEQLTYSWVAYIEARRAAEGVVVEEKLAPITHVSDIIANLAAKA